MNIEILTLCEHAQNTEKGLCLVGAYDTYFSKSAPFTIDKLTFAFRIRFEPSELGKHKIKASIYDLDGNPVFESVDYEMTAKTYGNSPSCTHTGIINLHGKTIREFGDYCIYTRKW